jgi:hypothetical protein
VPDDIERNGALQGSHTGPTEHDHIRLVKRLAKGTKQRAKVLDRQLGQHVRDLYIVDMAYQCMSSQYGQSSHLALSSLVQTTGLSSEGAKGWLFVDTQDDQTLDNHPTTPCFDLVYTKRELFSKEMVHFWCNIMQPCPHQRLLFRSWYTVFSLTLTS